MGKADYSGLAANNYQPNNTGKNRERSNSDAYFLNAQNQNKIFNMDNLNNSGLSMGYQKPYDMINPQYLYIYSARTDST